MGSFGGGGAKPGRRGGVCACMEGLAAPWRLRRAQLQPTALLGAAEPPPAASSATPGSSKIPPTRRSRLTTPTPPAPGRDQAQRPRPQAGPPGPAPRATSRWRRRRRMVAARVRFALSHGGAGGCRWCWGCCRTR